MSPNATWRRDLSTKLFLRVGPPFFYLLFFSSILLFVVLSPFIYLYGLLLCSMVWIDWSKKGKDLLVVYSSSEHSEEWMTRLSPLIADRAVFLDYGTRKTWERSSPAVLLFEIFGPKPTTEFFLQFYLPCVIVFPMFRRPITFNFGTHLKDREERFEQLRATVAGEPQESESTRD
jgi:hypothetical protein